MNSKRTTKKKNNGYFLTTKRKRVQIKCQCCGKGVTWPRHKAIKESKHYCSDECKDKITQPVDKTLEGLIKESGLEYNVTMVDNMIGFFIPEYNTTLVRSLENITNNKNIKEVAEEIILSRSVSRLRLGLGLKNLLNAF